MSGLMGSPAITATFFALAAAGLVFAIIFPFISGDRKRDQRVSAVAAGRARRGTATVLADTANKKKKNVADTLKEMEKRQKYKEKISMRLRLQRAGLNMTPRDFVILSLTVGLVSGFAVYSLVGAPLMAGLVVGVVAGLGLPRWFLAKLTKRRQNKFLAELPNAIDVVVRGVKSGLPLNDCLQVIARESPEPVASEFQEVCDQQRLGVPLGDGLERMCQRLPLAEMRFLTIVIAIQQQAGGNLSEALGNLAGVLRDRLALQLKVKALSAEAKASAIILASLPPTVMGIVGMSSPGYMDPMYSTTLGNFMLVGSGFWMLAGVLVMRKMINFKY